MGRIGKSREASRSLTRRSVKYPKIQSWSDNRFRNSSRKGAGNYYRQVCVQYVALGHNRQRREGRKVEESALQILREVGDGVTCWRWRRWVGKDGGGGS
jgi:hypothetical protein